MTSWSALLAPVLAAAPALPAAPGLDTSCPADMQRVRGVHYEQIQRLCLDYRRTHCFRFLPGLSLREPRASAVETCMDRYEWPNRLGADPMVMVSFVEAEAHCAAVGKRLCTEFEWELACEGAQGRPWPYGWQQRPGACHSDQRFRPYNEGRLISSDRSVRERETQRLWQGAAAGSHPDCASPFGVVDLVGNVEEWVATSRPQWPYRSSLKGGYWAKPWTGCRGTNERHAPMFRYYQIGFRCCADVGTLR